MHDKSSFGLAMGILARPNSPDMPPKRTKKVRLGIKRKIFYVSKESDASGMKFLPLLGNL